MNEDERKAIESLQRLAKRWPKSLTLCVSGSGGLTVIRSADADLEDLADAETLAVIDGIPVDNCA